jgi:hypothetical protein
MPFAKSMTAHHAFVVMGPPGFEFVSNATPVRIAQ